MRSTKRILALVLTALLLQSLLPMTVLADDGQDSAPGDDTAPVSDPVPDNDPESPADPNDSDDYSAPANPDNPTLEGDQGDSVHADGNDEQIPPEEGQPQNSEAADTDDSSASESDAQQTEADTDAEGGEADNGDEQAQPEEGHPQDLEAQALEDDSTSASNTQQAGADVENDDTDADVELPPQEELPDNASDEEPVWSLSLPGSQQIAYKAERTKIGTISVKGASGFTDGQAISVTLDYSSFSSDTHSIPIVITVIQNGTERTWNAGTTISLSPDGSNPITVFVNISAEAWAAAPYGAYAMSLVFHSALAER